MKPKYVTDGEYYVFLFQKLLKSRVFFHPTLLRLWIYILLTASRTHRWVPFQTGNIKTEIELQPGQLIFGRNSYAERYGEKPSSVRKRLMKLKSMGNVDTQSNNLCTIVTVCNWLDYQMDFNDEEQPKEQVGDNSVTSGEQVGDTNKRDKNVNTGSKSKRVSPVYSESFLQFWDEYPHSRRTDKPRCLKIWIDNELEKILDEILSALKNHKASKEWVDPKYIPNSSTWLHQERWNQVFTIGQTPDQIVSPHRKMQTR